MYSYQVSDKDRHTSTDPHSAVDQHIPFQMDRINERKCCFKDGANIVILCIYRRNMQIFLNNSWGVGNFDLFGDWNNSSDI